MNSTINSFKLDNYTPEIMSSNNYNMYLPTFRFSNPNSNRHKSLLNPNLKVTRSSHPNPIRNPVTSGPNPVTSGHDPATSGPTPVTQEFSSETSGPTQATSEHTYVISGPTPLINGPFPIRSEATPQATSGPTPVTSGPAPGTPGPTPVTREPIPVTDVPTLAIQGPTPDPDKPAQVPGGPTPAPGGPVPGGSTPAPGETTDQIPTQNKNIQDATNPNINRYLIKNTKKISFLATQIKIKNEANSTKISLVFPKSGKIFSAFFTSIVKFRDASIPILDLPIRKKYKNAKKYRKKSLSQKISESPKQKNI